MTPGSNLRADVVGSAWLLLLPSLDLGRVAIEGRIDAMTRSVLEGLCDDVGAAEPRRGPCDLVVVGAGAEPAEARSSLKPGSALYIAPRRGDGRQGLPSDQRVALVAGDAPLWHDATTMPATRLGAVRVE